MTLKQPDPTDPDSEGLLYVLDYRDVTVKFVMAPADSENEVTVLPVTGPDDERARLYIASINPTTVAKLEATGALDWFEEQMSKVMRMGIDMKLEGERNGQGLD